MNTTGRGVDAPLLDSYLNPHHFERKTMPAVATPTILERAQSLQSYIQSGRILEAMTEFYAEGCAMQENAAAPCLGLAANIEREKKFLSMVKEWKGYVVKALAVGENVSIVESTMDFVNTEGKAVHMEQVSVQRWKNGKIVHERFYYNAA